MGLLWPKLVVFGGGVSDVVVVVVLVVDVVSGVVVVFVFVIDAAVGIVPDFGHSTETKFEGAVGTESKEHKRESRKCKRNTNTKQTGRTPPPAKVYSKRKLNKNVVNTNEKEKPNWSNKRMKTKHKIGGIFSRILTLDFCFVFWGE